MRNATTGWWLALAAGLGVGLTVGMVLVTVYMGWVHGGEDDRARRMIAANWGNVAVAAACAVTLLAWAWRKRGGR